MLEYSDSVWDNCSNGAKRQLDSIHHKAARIITGNTKLCSIEKLLADLGWDSLKDHRTKHRLVIFYKIINNLTLNYLQEVVPPLVQDGNPYRLRNSSDIRTIYTNTNLFYNSFYPSTIREWNNLAQEIKDVSSVASLNINSIEKQGIVHLLSITQLVQEKGKLSMQDYVCNVAN